MKTLSLAVLIAALAAAPAISQDRGVQDAPQTVPAQPDPVDRERLPVELDPAQDPAELARTRDLNGQVLADLEAVDARIAEIAAEEEAKQAAWEIEQARYRQVVADAETARLNHEAAVRAAEAAQQQWARDRAAWEEQARRCERGDRRACAPPPAR